MQQRTRLEEFLCHTAAVESMCIRDREGSKVTQNCSTGCVGNVLVGCAPQRRWWQPFTAICSGWSRQMPHSDGSAPPPLATALAADCSSGCAAVSDPSPPTPILQQHEYLSGRSHMCPTWLSYGTRDLPTGDHDQACAYADAKNKSDYRPCCHRMPGALQPRLSIELDATLALPDIICLQKHAGITRMQAVYRRS